MVLLLFTITIELQLDCIILPIRLLRLLRWLWLHLLLDWVRVCCWPPSRTFELLWLLPNVSIKFFFLSTSFSCIFLRHSGLSLNQWPTIPYAMHLVYALIWSTIAFCRIDCLVRLKDACCGDYCCKWIELSYFLWFLDLSCYMFRRCELFLERYSCCSLFIHVVFTGTDLVHQCFKLRLFIVIRVQCIENFCNLICMKLHRCFIYAFSPCKKLL